MLPNKCYDTLKYVVLFITIYNALICIVMIIFPKNREFLIKLDVIFKTNVDLKYNVNKRNKYILLYLLLSKLFVFYSNVLLITIHGKRTN